MRVSQAFLPLAAALLITGCSSNETPATNAVAQAENAMNELRNDGQAYAPEELKATEATLANMKSNLEEEDYKGVIGDVPQFNAQVKSLREIVVQKQTQVAAAQNEWDALNTEVPPAVEKIQARVDTLKGGKLPKEVTKENYEAAKTEFEAAKATWAEASAAATAGKTLEAADKGREVQAKVKDIEIKLGMSTDPAALASVQTPPPVEG
jgi:hypothetical protein